MRTRRWITSVLVGALVSAAAPASTWAAGPGDPAPKAVRLQAAIRQAAADAGSKPALRLHANAPAPRSGARLQSSGGGGGHTGMIISLVSTAVGIGATVYMVKEMQKTTKAATAGQ